METTNQNSLTEHSTDLPKEVKEKSSLDRTLELFLINLEIMTVKHDLTVFDSEDLNEQRELLKESLSILLKKKINLIKKM